MLKILTTSQEMEAGLGPETLDTLYTYRTESDIPDPCGAYAYG